jgi:hypothetical protein
MWKVGESVNFKDKQTLARAQGLFKGGIMTFPRMLAAHAALTLPSPHRHHPVYPGGPQAKRGRAARAGGDMP